MITWFQVWPFLTTPFLFISLLAAIPTFTLSSRDLGGLPIREWVLNRFLLPVLPVGVDDRVLSWYSGSSTLDAWLLVALVALNLNAIMLPALYFLGGILINLSGRLASKSLELKTKAVRR
jgi:hypothetical protein